MIRARTSADLLPLAAALMDQQPETRYPLRNPLPLPVEDFLHAHDAVSAWTAEVDGRPVGHACRTGPKHGFPAADLLNELGARAHGGAIEDLTWVGALFVARGVRGLGVGRQLLAAVVHDARAADRHLCLEVLPVHPGAMALYDATGWRVAGSLRPDWLRAAAGDQGPDVVVMVLPDQPVPDLPA